MTTLRRFSCHDLFNFSHINLDYYTETVRDVLGVLGCYQFPFYLQYLTQWPEYCFLASSASGCPQGYVFGKAEGTGRSWHGHVTAVTVAPEARRQGLAGRLMGVLEDVTEKQHDAYFVDLFVRASNATAIGMYRKLGYSTHKRVLHYYGGSEDALDMRKAMPRDVDKQSVVPLGRDIQVWELEHD